MKEIFLGLFVCALWMPLRAQVSLAGIFTDNMVLQAHHPIRVWGKATPGEHISAELQTQHRTTVADKVGRWKVEFTPMEYSEDVYLRVVGKHNEVVFSNLMIGEVWLCSGQSNMAMTVNGSGGQVLNFKNEVNNADYPKIRSFKVKPQFATTEEEDVIGKWEVCSPQTVGEFSAVAYFFARKIYQETGIPIGIINSSWGGTDIETWISSGAFSTLPERFRSRYLEAERKGIADFLVQNEENRKAFAESVATDVGIDQRWYESSFNADTWPVMDQPKEWTQTALASFDGVVWMRHTLNLSKNDIGQPAMLSLGKVDDNDVTWVNGIQVGETRGAGYDREYEIPAEVLKVGENVITVRVVDEVRGGGFTGKPDELYLQTVAGRYSLAGEWHFQSTVSVGNIYYEDVVPNLYYGLLYNSMIAPLRDFGIKGVIWYQGENNAGRAYDYRTLFPTLINDWRAKWGYDFPFYWVQLANFMAKAEDPNVADSWAELREAQTLTLALPHTGQAIITDVGDANDIHPKNKQEVGARLAFIALNNDYNRSDIACTSPCYKASRIDGTRIIIEFDQIGTGLHVNSKYGYIEGFTIAGEDQRFVWAKAQLIDENQVVVWADGVDKPVAVRFGWSINPDVNLYNSAGLPAAPFRTDTWKLSTE